MAIAGNPIRQLLKATTADAKRLVNNRLKSDCSAVKALSNAAIAVHSASLAMLNCLLGLVSIISWVQLVVSVRLKALLISYL